MKTLFFEGICWAEDLRNLAMGLGVRDGLAWGLGCAYDHTMQRVVVSPGAVFFQGGLHSLDQELRLDYNPQGGGADAVVLYADNDLGMCEISIVYGLDSDGGKPIVPPGKPGSARVFTLCSVAQSGGTVQLVDRRDDPELCGRSWLRDDQPDLSGGDGISRGGTSAIGVAGAAVSLGAATEGHKHDPGDFAGIFKVQHGGVGSLPPGLNGSGPAVYQGGDHLAIPSATANNMVLKGDYGYAAINTLLSPSQAQSNGPVGQWALTGSSNVGAVNDLNQAAPIGRSFWLVDTQSQPTNGPAGHKVKFLAAEAADGWHNSFYCVQTALCEGAGGKIAAVFVRMHNGSNGTWGAWEQRTVTEV